MQAGQYYLSCWELILPSTLHLPMPLHVHPLLDISLHTHMHAGEECITRFSEHYNEGTLFSFTSLSVPELSAAQVKNGCSAKVDKLSVCLLSKALQTHVCLWIQMEKRKDLKAYGVVFKSQHLRWVRQSEDIHAPAWSTHTICLL